MYSCQVYFNFSVTKSDYTNICACHMLQRTQFSINPKCSDNISPKHPSLGKVILVNNYTRVIPLHDEVDNQVIFCQVYL